MRLVVTESTSRESHWSLEMQLIGLSILMGIVLYFWCMFLNAVEPTIHPPTEPAATAVSVDASPEALENIIAKSQKLYDDAAKHGSAAHRHHRLHSCNGRKPMVNGSYHLAQRGEFLS